MQTLDDILGGGIYRVIDPYPDCQKCHGKGVVSIELFSTLPCPVCIAKRTTEQITAVEDRLTALEQQLKPRYERTDDMGDC